MRAMLGVRSARGWLGLLLAPLLCVLAACAQPEGTVMGPRGPMSRDQAHTAVLEMAGGAYADQRVQAYVSQVGQRLAAHSGQSSIPWRFTVVDAEIPLALTSGSGDIYISRGMLALLNSEGELAGVLGHEMGHVALKHTARNAERRRAAIEPVAAALEARNAQEAAKRAIDGLKALQAHSRDDEREADRFALELLPRAGYTADNIFAMLRRLQDFDNFLRSRSSTLSSLFERKDAFASHPALSERADMVRNVTGGVAAPPVGSLHDMLDGLLVGVHPNLGVVRDNAFIQGNYGIRMTVPAKTLPLPHNRLPGIVWAGGMVMFQCEPDAGRANMVDWLKGRLRVTRGDAIQPFTMPNRDAASAVARRTERDTTVELRLVAARFDGRVCEFFGFTPRAGLEDTVAETIRSAAPASGTELASLRPSRLRIIRANAGDTLESVARRAGGRTDNMPVLALLNGVEAGARLEAGRPIKVIVRE